MMVDLPWKVYVRSAFSGLFFLANMSGQNEPFFLYEFFSEFANGRRVVTRNG